MTAWRSPALVQELLGDGTPPVVKRAARLRRAANAGLPFGSGGGRGEGPPPFVITDGIGS